MEWMVMPLRRYADFSGRSTRQEFWMFFLFQTLFFFAFLVVAVMVIGVAGIASTADAASAGLTAPITVIALGGFWLLYTLAMIVPNAAVIVRRCHDQGMSGWIGGILFALAFLMNIAGMIFLNIFGLALLVIMALPGNVGPNRYGADPKGDMGDIFA